MDGYRTQSPDTTREVEEILFEAYRRMPPSEKIRRVREMSLGCQQLALAGLRERYPCETERQLALRLAAFRLGPEVMREVFGFDPGQ